MGCLIALFAGILPRFALLAVWLSRPRMVDAAFDTWIWPFLGFLFLPLATLVYVILWQTGGLSGWDWFWVVLAGALDLGQGGAGWSQRRQVPGYRSSFPGGTPGAL